MRQVAIARALATGRPACTDFTQIVSDVLSGKVRAISGFYAPIRSPLSAFEGINGTTGFAFLIFQWSLLLTESLPSFLNDVTVVVASPVARFTFLVTRDGVTDLGPGGQIRALSDPLIHASGRWYQRPPLRAMVGGDAGSSNRLTPVLGPLHPQHQQVTSTTENSTVTSASSQSPLVALNLSSG